MLEKLIEKKKRLLKELDKVSELIALIEILSTQKIPQNKPKLN